MAKPFVAIQDFSAKRLLIGFCLASLLFWVDGFWFQESSGLRPLYVAFLFLFGLIDIIAAVTALLFFFFLYLPFLAMSIINRPFWQSIDLLFFLLLLFGAIVLAYAYGQTLQLHAYLRKMRLDLLHAFAKEDTSPFLFLADLLPTGSPLHFSLLKNWHCSGWGNIEKLKRTLRKRQELNLPNGLSLYYVSFCEEEGVLQTTSPALPREPLGDLAYLIQSQLDLVTEREETEKRQGVLTELLGWLPYPVFIFYEDQLLYSNQLGLLLLRDHKRLIKKIRLAVQGKAKTTFFQEKQLWQVSFAGDLLPFLPQPHYVVICQDKTIVQAQEANRFFFWYLEHIRQTLKKWMEKQSGQALSVPFLTSYTYMALTLLDFLKVSRQETLACQPRLCNQLILEQQLQRLTSFYRCSLCLQGEVKESFVLDTPRFLSLVNLMLSLGAESVEVELQEKMCTLSLSQASSAFADTTVAYTVEDMIGIYITLLRGEKREKRVMLPLEAQECLAKSFKGRAEKNP